MIAKILVIASLSWSFACLAQTIDFPTHTVKIVSPYTAGGSNDAVARLLAGKLAERWGQPVIVENRPGANAITGSDFVAKAKPDGHTLLTIPAAHVTNPFLQEKMPFDPAKDLSAVSIIGTIPFMLAVNPQIPVNTLADLVSYGRSNPGKLTFASNGAGSGAHLAGELFSQAADIKMLHVPYRGTSAALPDVLSGQVSMIFDAVQPLSPHVRSGKLRALAVTSAQRWVTEPGVPTAVEAGQAGFIADTWIALVTTAGTPAPVAEKIARDVSAILEMPDVKERLQSFGIATVGGTPESARRFVADESTKWGRVIRSANVRLN